MGKLSDLLFGDRMWPKNRDPRVKGPKPRILSPEATEAMRKLAEEHRNDDGNPSAEGCQNE